MLERRDTARAAWQQLKAVYQAKTTARRARSSRKQMAQAQDGGGGASDQVRGARA
jgi:hypothetical protein